MDLHCIEKLNLVKVTFFLLVAIKSVDCQNNFVNLLSDITLNNSSNYPFLNQSIGGKIHLKISPYQEHHGIIYVLTGVKLNATVDISDLIPQNNSNLTILWSTKDGNITAGLNSTSIEYIFKEPSDSNFIRVDVTRGNDTISAQIDLSVKAAVNVSEPIGKLFLEHGELLDVKFKIAGSKPFKYCYKFCQDGSILPCDFCFSYYETYENEIPISHYLHLVGNYTLMFYISNIVSEQTKHFTVKINDTVRPAMMPIAPLVSSVMAVCILLSGLVLHLHLRKKAYTETANFDFIRQPQEEEDWEEELSFIQRVRYLFCGENQDDYDENRQLTGAIGANRHVRTYLS